MSALRAGLRKQAEFGRVFQEGRSTASGALVLHWLPRDTDSAHAGFCVGKRLGGAVLRNRIKRLLRESWRALAAEVTTPADLVFVARMRGVQFSLTEWAATMRTLLVRAELISPGSDRM